VLLDAAADPRFADHPWVAAGPRARFCVALPLTTPGGLPIGALTVLDTRPRDDADTVVEALAPVTRMVGAALERRREMLLGGALTLVFDFEGRMRRLSGPWEDVFGQPPDSVVGRRFTDFVHPDDLARTLKETERLHEGLLTTGFENRWVGAGGEVRWLLWESRAAPEEGVIYAVARDISAIKRTELALRDSEERYRQLAENSIDMIARHSADGRVEYASSASTALVGYTPEELTGVDPYEMIHPEDVPAVSSLHKALLNGADGVRMVFRERHRDGHYVWVESMARTVRHADRPVGIQTVTRDISAAKRATEALQEAEERFRKAFEDAPIGMAIAGIDGAFQRVNRALGELLGYSTDELLQLGLPELTHAEDRRSQEEIDALLAAERRAVTLEKRFVRRDGSPVWIALSISLMRGGSGEPTGVLAQFLDMSERHRAEAEALRAQQAAERANRAKSAFLARMSHELRTPLNAILGFAQLLELEDLTPEQLDSAARIVRGGAHLVELIDDVLDISRIEAGEMAIELSAVPVGQLVDEVVSMLRPLAAERAIELRTETGDAELHARADRQRLKQVMVNLVSNAIKYGPEGSDVRVVAAREGEGELVRLSVSDEGPGLAPEQAERVFKPFVRLPEHAGVEGTGLGLALSRNLTRAMDGTIGVRPAEGGGSEFWVTLGTAAAEPDAAVPPEPEPDDPEPAGGEPRTLVYVEDSTANAEFTRRLLARRPNVELLVAGDIATGRQLVRERDPDAVMLDVDLPDGDGVELLAELKADPATAAMPVLVVTADARPSQEERVLAAGATAYVAKPIDVRSFLRMLDAALARRTR
jgi:PAS domain S-box-containing protein